MIIARSRHRTSSKARQTLRREAYQTADDNHSKLSIDLDTYLDRKPARLAMLVVHPREGYGMYQQAVKES